MRGLIEIDERPTEYRDEPHYVRFSINYLRQKLEKDLATLQYILTERSANDRLVDFRRQAKT
jgi:DNA-binding response OmpR family regulator